MSLDNIQLPPMVIGQLFKNSLVDVEKPLQNLGKFTKRILILVEHQNVVHLPDEDLQFLLGILSACKLSMEDVCIVNLCGNEQVNYSFISQKLLPATVLLFGVSPAQIDMPLSFPYYQLQRYSNVLYLSSPTLAALQNDKSAKQLLWNSLKQIFLS